jgi:hypothetical protein
MTLVKRRLIRIKAQSVTTLIKDTAEKNNFMLQRFCAQVNRKKLELLYWIASFYHVGMFLLTNQIIGMN